MNEDIHNAAIKHADKLQEKGLHYLYKQAIEDYMKIDALEVVQQARQDGWELIATKECSCEIRKSNKGNLFADSCNECKNLPIDSYLSQTTVEEFIIKKGQE